MKPYPAYKSSGSVWIGDIPTTWDVVRADWVLDMVKNTITKEELAGKEVFHYSIPSIQETGTGAIEEGDSVDSNKSLIHGNELLISKLNPRKGTVLISEPKQQLTICSTEFVVLIPQKTDLRFSYYLYLSHPTRERISSTVQSATYSHQRANPSDIYKIWIALPSLPEQHAIARYLDDKTKKIDALIEKKQRLIELLKEQRTAIINQAVTKGLDPNVKMKDSGVEWLGEIPEHWEVKRLKWLVSQRLMYGANEVAEADDPANPRYLRITDFDGDGNLRVDTFKSLPPEIAKDYLLTEGDVLFARSGATVGKTFQFKGYTGVACFAGYLIKATPNPTEILSDFLNYFTKSNAYENWKDSSFSQATIQNIGADKYNLLPIAVPPVAEQSKIVVMVDIETSKIDEVSKRTQKETELLQEYRTALISEVVTGKIDVRGWSQYKEADEEPLRMAAEPKAEYGIIGEND